MEGILQPFHSQDFCLSKAGFLGSKLKHSFGYMAGLSWIQQVLLQFQTLCQAEVIYRICKEKLRPVHSKLGPFLEFLCNAKFARD